MVPVQGKVSSDIPKWQLALLLGVPVTIGAAGFYYYYKKNKSKKKPNNLGKSGEGNKPDQRSDEHVEKKPLSPNELAESIKTEGNTFFKNGQYDLAIEKYTKAIETCPKESQQQLSTYYQNRAAAYSQLGKQQNVLDDCTAALEHNKFYIKALSRRAKAFEAVEKLDEALNDATALCMLERFGNQSSIAFADTVLRNLGKKRATDLFANRKPVLPSKAFVKNYFSAFVNDPIIKSVIEEDTPLRQALELIQDGELDNVETLSTAELSNNDSEHHHLALLLRATFHMLSMNTESALSDLEMLLREKESEKHIKSNALIKRALLKMQSADRDGAMNDFDEAEKLQSDNSDVYHHRGQIYLLSERMQDALSEFDKAISFAPECDVAHAQKCYAEFRKMNETNPSNIQEALNNFENISKRFPESPEVSALYGQALTDARDFERAEKFYDKALEKQPDSGMLYVHKGLLYVQWKNDINAAVQMLEKAVATDPSCGFAYESLGSIEVQRGKFQPAIEAYTKALDLSRTEEEMAHIYSLVAAAKAQLNAAKYMGIAVN